MNLPGRLFGLLMLAFVAFIAACNGSVDGKALFNTLFDPQPESGILVSHSNYYRFRFLAVYEQGGSVPDASFDCRLDDGDWRGCASPHTVTGLGNGKYQFAVRVPGNP